jgi:hypothetical protein
MQDSRSLSDAAMTANRRLADGKSIPPYRADNMQSYPHATTAENSGVDEKCIKIRTIVTAA